MNVTEAVERACQEPTLANALSWIAVWENDRAVKQALKNYADATPVDPVTGQMWDTCFQFCFELVLQQYKGPAPKGVW